MTLEELIPVLNDNHFYPSTQNWASVKGIRKVTGLMIEAPTAYLMDSKKKRLTELLAPFPVKIEEKEGHLLITAKKKAAKSKK